MSSVSLCITLVLLVVNPQEPTLTLVPVTTPKSTSVMCVIEDFYPEKLTGQWKVNNDSTNLKLESKLNEKTGLYKAYSFYQVSSETWNANTSYSCEVTHRGKQIIEEKNFKGKSFNVGVLVHTLTSISNSHKDTLLRNNSNSQIYT